MGQPLMVASLDIKAAFDFASCLAVCSLQFLADVPPRFRWVWLRENVRCTGAIVSVGGTSESFARSRGLPQGSSISPWIFNRLLQKLLEALQRAWAEQGHALPWLGEESSPGLPAWADNM